MLNLELVQDPVFVEFYEKFVEKSSPEDCYVHEDITFVELHISAIEAEGYNLSDIMNIAERNNIMFDDSVIHEGVFCIQKTL